MSTTNQTINAFKDILRHCSVNYLCMLRVNKPRQAVRLNGVSDLKNISHSGAIMFMWPAWLCGHHVYVAIMAMWPSWLCGYHVYVAIMAMWPSCLCGHHVYAAIMFMWSSCLCGHHGYVAIMFMRPSCLCGHHVYVAIVSIWPSCLCGHHGYVAIMFMWPSCLCGHHVYAAIMFMWLLCLYGHHVYAATWPSPATTGHDTRTIGSNMHSCTCSWSPMHLSDAFITEISPGNIIFHLIPHHSAPRSVCCYCVVSSCKFYVDILPSPVIINLTYLLSSNFKRCRITLFCCLVIYYSLMLFQRKIFLSTSFNVILLQCWCIRYNIWWYIKYNL